MQRLLVLLVGIPLALAGCASDDDGAEHFESTEQDPLNPPDDCAAGADRGAPGSDAQSSQGGGSGACAYPTYADAEDGVAEGAAPP